MVESLKLKFIEIIALMHSITSPILVGFFSIIPSSELKPFQNNPISLIFLAIGIFLFLLTFLFIKNSIDLKENKVNDTYANLSFYSSLGTLIFLIIAIMSLIAV